MKRFYSRLSALSICAFLIAAYFPFLGACGARTVRLSTYRLTLLYDDGILNGKMNCEYYNNSKDQMQSLSFNLYPNAYREGAKFPAVGKNYADTCVEQGSFGNMVVEEVSANGSPAAFEICGEDKNILSVGLKTPLSPDDKVIVDVKFVTTLQKNEARLGINEKTVNIANYYPIACVYDNGAFTERPYCAIGDPFNSDFANYSVSITLPSVYTVASSGKPVKCKPDGEYTEYFFELENARDFAFVLSENFSVLSDKCGSTLVNYYYYDDPSPDATLKEAVNALSFFDEYLSIYPYPVYSIAQTEFYCGGMEFPGLSYVSSQLTANDYGQYLYAVVHETAHQWFPLAVGNDEYESGYFDEGLAEFLSYKYYSHSDKAVGEQIKTSAEKSYRNYIQVQNALGKEADTAMKKNLRDFASEFEYVNVAYSKGLMLFCELENAAGEAAFRKILCNFIKSNKFARADESDFIRAFGAKKNRLKGIFESYIYGKALLCLQNAG